MNCYKRFSFFFHQWNCPCYFCQFKKKFNNLLKLSWLINIVVTRCVWYDMMMITYKNQFNLNPLGFVDRYVSEDVVFRNIQSRNQFNLIHYYYYHYFVMLNTFSWTQDYRENVWKWRLESTGPPSALHNVEWKRQRWFPDSVARWPAKDVRPLFH